MQLAGNITVTLAADGIITIDTGSAVETVNLRQLAGEAATIGPGGSAVHDLFKSIADSF